MKKINYRLLRLLELAVIGFSKIILPYGEVYSFLFITGGLITNLIKHRQLNVSKRRFNLAVIKKVLEMGDQYKDMNHWERMIYAYRVRHFRWVLAECLWFFILIALLIKAGQFGALQIVLIGAVLIKLRDFAGVSQLRLTQIEIKEYIKKTRGVREEVC